MGLGISVMKEHYGIFAELRPPSCEVVRDVIEKVTAVDVQKVNRPVGEIAERIIEGRTNQTRGGRIFFTVPRGDGLEDALVVEPGVLIAFPMIDRVGGGAEPEPVNGLAESEVGIAVVCAELNAAARP